MVGVTMNITVLPVKNKRYVNDQLAQAIEKLKAHVEKHFQYKCSFKTFSVEPTKNEKILMGLLLKNNPLHIVDRVIYPIVVFGKVVGVFEVRARMLRQKALQIKDLVDLYVHKGLLNNELNSMEQNQAQQQASNVVSLANYKKKSADTSINSKLDIDSSQNFNRPCVVKAVSSDDGFKFAHEIHLLSNRYAFLYYADLYKEDLTLNDLLSLGPITLYISDLMSLNNYDLALIQQLIEHSKQKKDIPQVIASVGVSAQDLSTRIPQLYKSLNDSNYLYIEMSRQFSEIGSSALVEPFHNLTKGPFFTL